MTALDGAVAVVTGAAAGIGRATAERLVAAGARVVGVDLVECEGLHGSVRGDLADTAFVGAIVADVAAVEGHVDILVNNAGIARHNPITELADTDLDAMWAVNARATMLLCRDALAHMAARGDGQIVNVVSTAALRGGPGEAAYCATKAAVRAFTEGLVDEARLAGVRVHGIYPAGVDTAFWAAATREGPGVDTAQAFLRAGDVADAIVYAVSAPAHVHVPELVVRASADGDTEATRRKLEWFRS